MYNTNIYLRLKIRCVENEDKDLVDIGQVGFLFVNGDDEDAN